MTKSSIRKILWVAAFAMLAGVALPGPASANDVARPAHHKSMHHHHHPHHHHHHATPVHKG